MRTFLAALIVIAAGGAVPAAAAQPARPPDGTYTYSEAARSGASITSTIVVQSAGTSFTVSEASKLPNSSVLVRETYDAATLLPTHYEVHQRSGLTNTDLMASITPSAISFDGLPLAYHAGEDAKYILIGEGLNAYRVMMPWTIAANAQQPFTFAALNGNTTLPGKVVAASETRPQTVAASDQALAAQIGNDTLTFWFNPQTHVTDEVDASNGAVTRLVSYNAAVTKLAEPTAVTHVALEPAHYTDTQISVPSTGAAVLAGVLSVPDGTPKRYPAVIMVHGSGPETRDGGTPANPTFLLLANRLANAGIAVLRYDKRGIGQSTGTPTEDWRPLGDDVRAMVAFLKKQPQIDPGRIFLVGHSEGGLVVPLVADAAKVRGIVLMAGPALPLHDILVKQGLNRMSPAQQQLLTDGFAAYDGIDPAEVIRTVDVPILMLQGGKDGQVLASDFPRLVAAAEEAHRKFRAIVLPEDDHLFIELPKSQKMQGSEIVRPAPLDPRVASGIALFVRNF